MEREWEREGLMVSEIGQERKRYRKRLTGRDRMR